MSVSSSELAPPAPSPHPKASVAPPWFQGGGLIRLRERGRGKPIRTTGEKPGTLSTLWITVWLVPVCWWDFVALFTLFFLLYSNLLLVPLCCNWDNADYSKLLGQVSSTCKKQCYKTTTVLRWPLNFSVADPVCISQIPDPTCFHPGSASQNLRILTQKIYF